MARPPRPQCVPHPTVTLCPENTPSKARSPLCDDSSVVRISVPHVPTRFIDSSSLSSRPVPKLQSVRVDVMQKTRSGDQPLVLAFEHGLTQRTPREIAWRHVAQAEVQSRHRHDTARGAEGHRDTHGRTLSEQIAEWHAPRVVRSRRFRMSTGAPAVDCAAICRLVASAPS
jgi:hypothetical protein